MVLLLIPILSYSQKLKIELDKFTNQKRLETPTVTLKARATQGLAINFRSVDSLVYVILYGYGDGTGTISNGEEAIFLLDDGTTIKVYSTGIQSFDVGKSQNTYQHQYKIQIGDLQKLSLHDLKSIRKYTTKNYSDIDIPAKHSGEVGKLAKLILEGL